MQMRANYEQLGIAVEPADFRDLLGIVSVHAETFIDTYHTEGIYVFPPESPYYITRDVVERFVYKSDFLERKVHAWQQRIEEQTPDQEVLVARHNEKVVGFSHTSFEEKENTLGALFILPEYQRRYLGRALLRTILGQPDQKPVDLDVVLNTPAIGFYQHFGFEIAGSLSPEDCPEMKPGKWLPLLHMVRGSETAGS